MIPLHKLIELPRTLRLRKAASLFGEAERRFIITKRLEPEKVEYLGRVAELLAKDEKFSNVATEALNNAGLSFASAAASDSEIRRSLNSVYNLLLAETGRSQADWDFIEASGSFDLSNSISCCVLLPIIPVQISRTYSLINVLTISRGISISLPFLSTPLIKI